MSYRFLMIYGLITDWMDSLLMRVGKTVGRAGFGRKIRGPVLVGMPIIYPSGDVRQQLDNNNGIQGRGRAGGLNSGSHQHREWCLQLRLDKISARVDGEGWSSMD